MDIYVYLLYAGKLCWISLLYKYTQTVSAAVSSSLFLACGSQSNEAAHTLMRTHEATVKKLFSCI